MEQQVLVPPRDLVGIVDDQRRRRDLQIEQAATLNDHRLPVMGEGEEVAVVSHDDPAKRSGTISGNAKWSAGKFGGALEFDGETFVPLGEVGTFEQSDTFSFSAWVNLASHKASTVLSKMDEANAFRGYDLIIEQGKVAMHIIHHWPDNGLKVIAKEPLPLNTWHHIVVAYDGKGKGNGVAIYVDGKLQTADITTNTLSGKDSIKTDKPFHLGRRTSSAPFHGMLDEVQLYRREVTEAFVNGQVIHAWIYWYNGDVSGRPVIASGDILEYLRDKKL